MRYDPAGNITSRTLRDGAVIAYAYDDLGRLKTKTRPGEPLVTYGYDLLGRLLSASQPGHTLSFTYDALGRNLTQVGPLGTVTSEYDLAGRRTKVTYPGTGLYVNYDYLVTGEVTKIRENGALSGVGVLATYAYDDLGRRNSLTRGNTAVTSYGYDAVSRLDELTDNLAGTASDITRTFAYNPAGQIMSVARSNDSYAWGGHVNLDRDYAANGLNQYTLSGAVVPTYDLKGNLTQAGGATYTYSSENLLTTATGGIALAYDPLNRLYQTSGGSAGVTKLGYDGAALIAEYNSANGLLRRYVHGPGMDEPLVWYEGAGVTDRRWLHADERGSIVAVTNGTGGVLAINSYDEYGIPDAGNLGRFQYTGQTWIAELGMYYYKNRLYSPTLGRFMQTDPIGYAGGMNLYGYVGNDPINFTDPWGLTPYALDNAEVECVGADICVTGSPINWTSISLANLSAALGGFLLGNSMSGEGKRGEGGGPTGEDCNAPGADPNTCTIVVNGTQPPKPKVKAPPFTINVLPVSLSFGDGFAAEAYNPRVNYCGAAGGARFPSGTWNSACYAHDVCYGTRGASKTTCDLNFAYDIRQQCRASDPNDPLCGAAAIIYFYAVLFGGGEAFENAQKGVR